jgi:hypothetical protein
VDWLIPPKSRDPHDAAIDPPRMAATHSAAFAGS